MVRQIIWINGTFGSGKTATAFELHRRIGQSHVFDPEEAGYYIRKHLPPLNGPGDFQDYPMWRLINQEMLHYMCPRYDGVLIIPMTVVNKAYLEEMTQGLVEAGYDLRHYTLMASEKSLKKRLRLRGEGKNSWGTSHIQKNLELLKAPEFQQHIDTDRMTIHEVVETIADDCGISLDHDRLAYLPFKLERLRVQIKHMRLQS